jgi:hypothetical protein
MAIFCKQKNGSCFLVASADYRRSPYGDFQAIRWKEQLRAISSVGFWDIIRPELCDVDVSTWRQLREGAVEVLQGDFAAHHMLGGLEPSGKHETYSSESVVRELSKKPEWLRFLELYKYSDSIDGSILDWKKPPIRAILDTGELDKKGSGDIQDLICSYLNNVIDRSRVTIINNIPNQYGYMWFNFTALLKGIDYFISNSTVNIQVSLNITDTTKFKGAVIQIYQIGDDINPNTMADSRYHYNSNFPFPKNENKMRTLGYVFKYFFYAGVQLVVYRAYDAASTSKKYLQSIIQLNDDLPLILHNNLPSNNLFDATLCLFIPAEITKPYRKEWDPWLVTDNLAVDINTLKERISE